MVLERKGDNGKDRAKEEEMGNQTKQLDKEREELKKL